MLDGGSLELGSCLSSSELTSPRYVPYVASAMIEQNDTEHFNVSGALMYDPVIGQVR
jgi:carboxypeptidase D